MSSNNSKRNAQSCLLSYCTSPVYPTSNQPSNSPRRLLPAYSVNMRDLAFMRQFAIEELPGKPPVTTSQKSAWEKLPESR
jgi:hypothetical protein